MSNGALLELFRHNAWATSRILETCRGLTAEQLDAALPGVYGGIRSTLQHYLDAEGFYRSLFSGVPTPWSRPESDVVPLEELSAWADDMAPYWEGLLSSSFDETRLLRQRRRNGSIDGLQSGMMLAQTIHHSNVHREQICAVITSLGQEAPDVSGWRFGYETGRIVRGVGA